MRFEGKSLDGTIELDGNEFINCTFGKCHLIYSGGVPPRISGCSFGDFQIAFHDAAGRTVAFMTALYSGGFQPIIEATIDNIRGNDNILNTGILHEED